MKETLISSETVYNGEIFDIHKDKIKTVKGNIANRDILVHKGAAAAVPLTDKNEVILVKQYRHATGNVLLEIPAGGLEPNEDPKDCIIRELQEEIGLKPNIIEHIYSIFLAPGYSTEYLHIYLAKDLIPSKLQEDQDENLEIVKIKIDKLVEMILNGEIKDAKTIAAVFSIHTKISK